MQTSKLDVVGSPPAADHPRRESNTPPTSKRFGVANIVRFDAIFDGLSNARCE